MHLLKRTLTLYTLTRLLLIAGICALFLWYVLFQSRILIAGPIVLLSHDVSVVQHERVIIIEGLARNVVSVTLNGRAISVDETGVFRESLVLENGYSVMTIEAKDRYGRTNRIEQPFMYSSS